MGGRGSKGVGVEGEERIGEERKKAAWPSEKRKNVWTPSKKPKTQSPPASQKKKGGKAEASVHLVTQVGGTGEASTLGSIVEIVEGTDGALKKCRTYDWGVKGSWGTKKKQKEGDCPTKEKKQGQNFEEQTRNDLGKGLKKGEE